MNTMPATLATIAAQITAAQDQRVQITTPFSTQHPNLTLAQAYAIADSVHQQRCANGAQVVGRKIGFTNAQLWPQFGVNAPVWGYVYQHTLVDLTVEPATLDISPLLEPRIEPEIILHFHTAPPVTTDLAEILSCIDWVSNGFEIVQTQYPNWKFQAADTVIAQALHGKLLLGEKVPVQTLGAQALSKLQNFTIDLHCNGAHQASGVGANVLGGPLMAIAHLIVELARNSPAHAIQAGELVTTGSLTAALSIQTGQTWHSTPEGIELPPVRVGFVG